MVIVLSLLMHELFLQACERVFHLRLYAGIGYLGRLMQGFQHAEHSLESETSMLPQDSIRQSLYPGQHGLRLATHPEVPRAVLHQTCGIGEIWRLQGMGNGL